MIDRTEIYNEIFKAFSVSFRSFPFMEDKDHANDVFEIFIRSVKNSPEDSDLDEESRDVLINEKPFEKIWKIIQTDRETKINFGVSLKNNKALSLFTYPNVSSNVSLYSNGRLFAVVVMSQLNIRVSSIKN